MDVATLTRFLQEISQRFWTPEQPWVMAIGFGFWLFCAVCYPTAASMC